jgi:hypothetical protein
MSAPLTTLSSTDALPGTVPVAEPSSAPLDGSVQAARLAAARRRHDEAWAAYEAACTDYECIEDQYQALVDAALAETERNAT